MALFMKKHVMIVVALFTSILAFGVGLPDAVDWIVVGGGAAGCTAAAALADSNADVLVIERGPDDRSIASSQSGTTWPKVVVDAVENIRWVDGPWGAVAKVLGGGASVNDGYFFEEEPEFLKQLLQFTEDDLQDFYTSSKYLASQLTTPLSRTDYGFAYAEALELAGHGKADLQDLSRFRYKDGQWIVQSLFNTSEAMQTRYTPAILLHQRSHLKNLQVATGTNVKKIIFDGVRAVGVSVNNGNGTVSVNAKKGVLIASGAIYTPQLLQISGVGDAELLSKLGVRQVVDLPGVGQNFVDRLTWTVQVAAPKTIPHYIGYTVAANTSVGITFESVGGRGVDSQMAIPSLGLAPAKQRSAALRPIMKALMDSPIGNIVDQMSNIVGLVHNTKSRGTIEAVSMDSSMPPRVTANYFSVAEDLNNMVKDFRELINVAKQSPLDPWKMRKAFEPPSKALSAVHIDMLKEAGANVSEDGIPDFLSCLFKTPDEQFGFITLPCPPADASKWAEFLQDNVLSTYHYFGTAAVGSVVERGTFRVEGTQGLYVIDASAIPYATRINPVGTIMTLGHFVGRKLAKADNTQIFV